MASIIPNPFKYEGKGGIPRSTVIVALFALVAIAGVGSAGYFYYQYQASQAVLGDSSNPEQEVKHLVEEVGKLIVLPKGEQPQIATVSDVNKLKEQAFFSQAKNGDKVLIYTQAKKAILYDPLQNKVVEVGPINLAEATPGVSPAVAQVNVALYNGAGVSGLTQIVQEELTQGMANVTVVARQNAAKSTYTKTLVVDLKGNQKAAATQLASILDGETSALPAGEKVPQNADLLVILGKE